MVDLESGGRPARYGGNGRHLAALGWTAFIFLACWFPRISLPVPEPEGLAYPLFRLDKLIHGAMFAGFGFLGLRAVAPTARARMRLLLLGLALAPITEFGQWMPWVGRDAGWADGAADVAGLLVGSALYFLAPGRSPRAEA